MLRPRSSGCTYVPVSAEGNSGIEARELVAGVEPRGAEVDREPAAGPRRPAGEAGAAVNLRPFEPALGRAANRRRVRAHVALIAEVRRDPWIVEALGRAHALARVVDVELGNRHVVVVLERHPDGVGQGDRQWCVGDADARCEWRGDGGRLCRCLRHHRGRRRSRWRRARWPEGCCPATSSIDPCPGASRRPVRRPIDPVTRSQRRPTRAHAGDCAASSKSE